MTAACRHDRYRVEKLHVVDCWDRAECIVWQCVRCGALLEPHPMGKTTKWEVVGYDPLVHVADVWRTVK